MSEVYRGQSLADLARGSETVTLEGIEFRLREIDVARHAQLAAFRDQTIKASGQFVRESIAVWIAASLVGESGGWVFGDLAAGVAEILGADDKPGWPFRFTSPLGSAALRVNKLTTDEAEELKKTTL